MYRKKLTSDSLPKHGFFLARTSHPPSIASWWSGDQVNVTRAILLAQGRHPHLSLLTECSRSVGLACSEIDSSWNAGLQLRVHTDSSLQVHVTLAPAWPRGPCELMLTRAVTCYVRMRGSVQISYLA